MSELLSSAFSGGGFATRLASTGIILAGSTGTVLTLTPPAGQKVRLTALSQDPTYEQAGISILFDSTEVITEGRLRSAAPEGTNSTTKDFSVGSYFPYSGSIPPVGNFLHFTGKQDEELIITKTAGGTGQNIYYAYEFGE